jgi:hypothetical protein
VPPIGIETVMSVSLTFQEVEEAGLFAWRRDHFLFLPEQQCFARVVDGEQRADVEGLDIRRSDMRGDESGMQKGWHHFPDCHCRFCQTGHIAEIVDEILGEATSNAEDDQ